MQVANFGGPMMLHSKDKRKTAQSARPCSLSGLESHKLYPNVHFRSPCCYACRQGAAVSELSVKLRLCLHLQLKHMPHLVNEVLDHLLLRILPLAVPLGRMQEMCSKVHETNTAEQTAEDLPEQ